MLINKSEEKSLLNKKKLLITAPLSFAPELLEEIKLKFDVFYEYQPPKEELVKLIKKFQPHAWIPKPCNEYLIDEELIKLSSNLEIIATPSTGTNHINLEIAKKLNIEIFSLKNSDVVHKIKASSEYTFALILATVRKIPKASIKVKEGNWRKVENSLRSRELSELTLGIVGCGRIGGNLIKYSEPFGMKINVYDPYIEIPFNNRVNVCEELEILFKNSDIVAICVHLNEETRGMIGEKQISQMKQGSFLINTSRGEILDEKALIKGLESGILVGAGVDVVCDEHLLPNNQNILINYSKNNNNLIVTPHIAGLTSDSEKKAQRAAYEACLKHFNLN